MTQHTLFSDLPTQLATDRSQHGAQWRVGNWNCRNFHGYFQSREVGARNWCFQIYSFGDTSCDVYTLDKQGEMRRVDVPIDHKDQITILGHKYGRAHWAH